MKVLDLFSGIGGFSLGLERAGMQTVSFCEIDPYCRAVLKKHWPAVPCFEDIRTLRGEPGFGLVCGSGNQAATWVDVICGGFPCQDISKAGFGRGLSAARSGLWFDYLRLISEIRPSWAVIENVSAIRARGLDQILGGLAEIGYDAEWHCIPASSVGAPQARDRVWVIAHPKREGMAGLLPLLDSGELGSWQWAGEEDLQAIANAPFIAGDRWPAPMLRRMDDGFPNRVDRLRALGNAVVPQIPEIIGRAIMRTTIG